MRRTFSRLMQEKLKEDIDSVLLLGDIGVFSFRSAFDLYPERVFNVGILEQSMIGLAAGLAKSGLNPFVHTIAPFLVERPLEQLKIDFGYQKLKGNFISVGASFDYSALGCTHHCPADVTTLLGIPGFEIYVPGTEDEFIAQFNHASGNNSASYFRLSEESNTKSFHHKIGMSLVRAGEKCTVLSVGPTLDMVEEACQDHDVEIIYVNSIYPFDKEFLVEHCKSGKMLVVEPFYSGTINFLITEALSGRNISLTNFGIPRSFINEYGSVHDLKMHIGFTSENLRKLIFGL